MRLVGAFFGDIKGYFVEVGAKEPRERSQTWFLEQAGWTGVLVEPQPDLAVQLRAKRKARVVACSPKMPAGIYHSMWRDRCPLSIDITWRLAPCLKESLAYRSGRSTAS
jgi:hypothetical protein